MCGGSGAPTNICRHSTRVRHNLFFCSCPHPLPVKVHEIIMRILCTFNRFASSRRCRMCVCRAAAHIFAQQQHRVAASTTNTGEKLSAHERGELCAVWGRVSRCGMSHAHQIKYNVNNMDFWVRRTIMAR